MKAERRHDLKTNALAKNLENAPAFFQQHGSRILVGIIFALLIYILVQNHLKDKAQKAENSAKNLGNALYALNELRSIPGRASPDQLALMRKEYSHDAENAITEVLSNTDDPKVRAAALVAKGDLNWELANFPALPGATTRPELSPDKTSDVYLTDAASAYNEVLEPPLNNDQATVTAARLSLGKIAENRSQWDQARKYYQQVVDDSSAGTEFKDWAKKSIDELTELEKTPYIGSAEGLLPPVAAPRKFGPTAPEHLTTEPTSAVVPSTQSTLLNKSSNIGAQPVFTVPATRPTTRQ